MAVAKSIKRKGIKGDGTWGYIIIAVSLLVFAMFTAYPVVSAFIISLQKYKPLGSTYVGFDNYASSLKDGLFWQAMKNTLVYTVLTVPVNLFLSMAIAVLILPLRKKTQSFFKGIYYLPVVASGVALSVVWLWIFDPLEGGILNQLDSLLWL
jgi:multiple sugar transport system permease protein